MTVLFSITVVAMVLIIWFKSEAYVEYCRLFKFDTFSQYRDYYQKRSNDVSLTYHAYLRQYHDSFLTRLITCPICFSAWLSIGLGLLFLNLAVIPCAFVGGLILFGITHRLLE